MSEYTYALTKSPSFTGSERLQAKALLTSARLSYLPSLALAPQGSLTSVDKSTPVKNYTLPASASWEVDLFGKLLNAHRGQKASYLQSKAYQQAVRSQLIGGIANAYILVCVRYS